MVAISITDLSSDEPVTNYGQDQFDGMDVFEAGWTDAGGLIYDCDGSSANMDDIGKVFEAGKSYKVEFTVSNYVAGTIQPKLRGGVADDGASFNGDGDYVDFIDCTDSANNELRFKGVTFNGTISNISIVEVFTTTYVGAELVTNGGFDTDISGWTDQSEGTGSTSWNPSGYIDLNTGADSANEGRAYQAITTVINAVYLVEIKRASGASMVNIGTTPTGQDLATTTTDADAATEALMFTATGTTSYVGLRNFIDHSATSSIDNISVKEQSAPSSIIETTLTASDSLAFAAGQKMVLILRNTSGGALTPTLDGAGGTIVDVEGIGAVNVSNGHTLASVADGAVVAIHLDTIAELCKGDLTITGADGMTATCVRY